MASDINVHDDVVIADYFQFQVTRTCGESIIDEPAEPEIGVRQFGNSANVGVASQMARLPVRIEVLPGPPDSIAPAWQHVAECGLDGHGGVQLQDMLGATHDAISVPAEPLRMRVHWKGWASGKRVEIHHWFPLDLPSEMLLIQLWAGPATGPATVLRSGVTKENSPFDHDLPPLVTSESRVAQQFLVGSLAGLDLLGRITGSHLSVGEQVHVAGFGEAERASFAASILQGIGVPDPAFVIGPGDTIRYEQPVPVERRRGQFDVVVRSDTSPECVTVLEHDAGFSRSLSDEILSVSITPRTHVFLVRLSGSRRLWEGRIRAIWDATSPRDWRAP